MTQRCSGGLSGLAVLIREGSICGPGRLPASGSLLRRRHWRTKAAYRCEIAAIYTAAVHSATPQRAERVSQRRVGLRNGVACLRPDCARSIAGRVWRDCSSSVLPDWRSSRHSHSPTRCRGLRVRRQLVVTGARSDPFTDEIHRERFIHGQLRRRWRSRGAELLTDQLQAIPRLGERYPPSAEWSPRPAPAPAKG